MNISSSFSLTLLAISLAAWSDVFFSNWNLQWSKMYEHTGGKKDHHVLVLAGVKLSHHNSCPTIQRAPSQMEDRKNHY